MVASSHRHRSACQAASTTPAVPHRNGNSLSPAGRGEETVSIPLLLADHAGEQSVHHHGREA